MRQSAQPFLWKWVLFAWEWKIISISKAEHVTGSFWYRGPGELGSGLLLLILKLILKQFTYLHSRNIVQNQRAKNFFFLKFIF